ncbi:MAG: cytochrome c oxidase subunit 3 [Bacteroidota bacterium]
MAVTDIPEKEKNTRAKKMMLWFGMVSLVMAFAGWTSAYIFSGSREDWVKELQLPSSFYISAAVIITSSLTYILAKRAIKKGNGALCSLFLVTTLLLGIAFIQLQFNGFSQMLSNGYYFTGPSSSIKMSYIFLIAAVHVVHVVAGVISLLVVLYNQLKGRYSSTDYLGLSLGATFWHFLDVLWVYLILFMTFVK